MRVGTKLPTRRVPGEPRDQAPRFAPGGRSPKMAGPVVRPGHREPASGHLRGDEREQEEETMSVSSRIKGEADDEACALARYD